MNIMENNLNTSYHNSLLLSSIICKRKVYLPGTMVNKLFSSMVDENNLYFLLRLFFLLSLNWLSVDLIISLITEAVEKQTIVSTFSNKSTIRQTHNEVQK